MNGGASTEVLVVGAGPTGLMAAIELARQGVQCRIIDQASRPSGVSKALCVQARTLEYFERLGIADEAVCLGRPMYGMHLFSNRKQITYLPLDGIGSRYNFILILPQYETERLLADRLAQEGISIERDTAIQALDQDQHGVCATLMRHGKDQVVRADWLLGCDGAHSRVRQLTATPFGGYTFEETFAVADAYMDWDGPRDAFSIYLHRGRILVLFPLPNNQYRIALATHNPYDRSEGRVSDFQDAIDQWGPAGARIRAFSWMSRFRISQRRVSRYRTGRVMLAGDAAHLHSPVGGQGMNTGIQDAVNVAWKLALITKGHAIDNLLDSYEGERKPLGTRLLWTTGAVTRLTMSKQPVVTLIRDALTRALFSSRSVQRTLQRALSQIDISYRTSRIVEDALAQRKPPGGGERTLHLPPVSKHLLLHPDPTAATLEVARRNFHDLIDILPATADGKGALILVRPDGYIGLRCDRDDWDALWRYMARIGVQRNEE